MSIHPATIAPTAWYRTCLNSRKPGDAKPDSPWFGRMPATFGSLGRASVFGCASKAGLFFRHTGFFDRVTALAHAASAGTGVAGACGLAGAIKDSDAAAGPIVDACAAEAVFIPGTTVANAGHKLRAQHHRGCFRHRL